MTRYRDRLEAGEYQGNASTATTRQDTVYDPDTGGTTAVDVDEVTLRELQEQAEALGLATYGTKAQIAQRIADAA